MYICYDSAHDDIDISIYLEMKEESSLEFTNFFFSDDLDDGEGPTPEHMPLILKFVHLTPGQNFWQRLMRYTKEKENQFFKYLGLG